MSWILRWDFLVTSVYAALAIPNGKSSDKYSAITNVLALVLWYFIAGRPQAKFVSEKLKKVYTRRSWFAPICSVIIVVGAMYKLGDLLK
jgi:hypothetical protein